MTHLIWLLVALPAAGAAILLLGGRRTDAWGHLLGCATPLASFGVGCAVFDMLSRHGDARTINRTCSPGYRSASLQVDFGMQVDQLSICFVLLITGVGSLIHIYSVGYMAEDLIVDGFSPTSTCSSRRCCCWWWRTTTSASTPAGKAWAWRPTC